MALTPSKVAIPDSEKKPVPRARAIGPAAPNERLEVTVRVRRRQELPDLEVMATQLPSQRQYITREEYEANHGAAPEDLKKVEAFAQQHNLTVVESSVARRSVILSGTVEDFSQAFGVTLETYEHPEFTYRGRVGEVYVPTELADIVEGVFGLDNRPVAKPHIAHLQLEPHQAISTRTFTPPELAQIYNFPTDVNGQGQCIGIIEMGGGYRPADLQAYFQKLNIPMPKVTSVSVSRGQNHPVGSPNSADGEVVLDIEVAAAIAPGAHIVVYFAPNASGQSFLNALTTAIHDSINKPTVLSISWGEPESPNSLSFMKQFDQALQTAAALGITVCCAAGDNGAADTTPDHWDGKAHADFPASSPFALACGGTRLEASNGSITSETVWNHGNTQSFGSTGGGVSDFFPLPSWQAGSGIPNSVNPDGRVGRGVPDVAGVADPTTGYDILVDGQFLQGIGGTSAVAPLWAGLIALINQSIGKPVGYLNPLLYGPVKASECFNNITVGDNKVGSARVGYSAGQGWNACTGFGSPNGQKLLKALRGGAA